jgi:exopolysaccharide production protein ExoQ
MVRVASALICAFVIWELFRLNRAEDRDVQTSKALWIPTFWLFIASSRNVSAWLQYSSGSQADQYLEGSPLDRAVLTFVLALGVIVLLQRTGRVGAFLRSNLPILLYFLYCGISCIWSDYPDVSVKRWFRSMGDVVMVLVVLTDPNWLVAIRRLLARIGFVIIPLSVLFIRYFPELGRAYSKGGAPSWTGVSTDKNALGMLSLLFGLAFMLRFLQLWREENPRPTRSLLAYGSLTILTFYLLWEANSATAFSCYFMAGGPMVLTYLYRWARKPAMMNAMVIAVIGVSFSALFLNIGSGMVQDLGRNSTLTGRTDIWRFALGLVQNPLIGTGYESFWIGPRLATMKVLMNQGINQAHNGYIEVYLNLGWTGVALLAAVLINAYGRINKAVRRMAPLANLRLAYFILAIAYNFTEAGFKMMHPVWIMLLLTIMIPLESSVPEPSRSFDLHRASRSEGLTAETRTSGTGLKPGTVTVGARFSGRALALRAS